MYYWVHLKECCHGDPWPCVQPDGYSSCGKNGWTIARKDGDYYMIVASDCPCDPEDFDNFIPVLSPLGVDL